MNVKYCIMIKQMLITLEKQLIYFPGKKIFKNLNINGMIFLFNKTVKNIISNYIPLKQLHLMIEIFRGLAK